MRIIRALLVLALLASPAHAQVWLWSQNPVTNGNIDSTINWLEGMPPSAVNDSSRAEMAGLAKWRDDSNGLVTLTGGPTAYAATTNQGNQSGTVSSLTPGYKLCFSPNVANGASPTLTVDGQAVKPLRLAPATNLVGSELRVGTPYCATYFSSNGGEYILNEFYAPIISGGSISYAQIQNVGASRLLGNPTGSPASVSEISLGAGLGFSGTSVLVPTNGITTSMVTASAITYAKMQNENNATVLGNDSGGAAAPNELTLGAGLSFLSSTSFGIGTGALSSGMYAAGSVNTAAIGNSQVTYGKIQNENNATLLGNDSGGAAAPNEITLGGSLAFTSATVVDAKVVSGTTVITSGTNGDCMDVLAGKVDGNFPCASLTAADQTLSGGANVTSLSQGAGNITIDCGARPLQYQTNGAAFTLTAPANDGSCMLLSTNNATAGTITFSGFTVSANTGDPLDTVNTHKFLITIVRINGTATYTIKALQ